jgi:hypothetical protein
MLDLLIVDYLIGHLARVCVHNFSTTIGTGGEQQIAVVTPSCTEDTKIARFKRGKWEQNRVHFDYNSAANELYGYDLKWISFGSLREA